MRWHDLTVAYSGPKGKGLKMHWAHGLSNKQLRSKVKAQ